MVGLSSVAVAFDPTSGSTIHTTPVPSSEAVSCPSVSECVTSPDGGTTITTFNPQTGAGLYAARLAGPEAVLGGIDCQELTQCTSITTSGFVTYDPLAPGSQTG